MDTGLILLLTVALGAIVLIIQRTEATKRRRVSYFMFIFVLLTGWYVAARQAWGEGLVSLFLALFLNLLFWMLIGRYNPVGTSDDIHVLGMDD